LVEPEVVATSPNRIKSPVPVCCGFGSVTLVLALPRLRDTCTGDALPADAGSCLCYWTTRAKELDPPAGAAPAGSLYKSNPQAAAWRRCGWHANASQSPVPPRTERAYETRLSAGSTAKWIPHPELHRADSLTERMHR